MDVDSFIAKYRPEWVRLESACSRGARGLSKLRGEEIDDVVHLYERASAHLAEARTRYRDPGLHDYLNGIVTRAYAALYAAHPRTIRGFFRLFGTRYRAAIRRTLPQILVAAVLIVVVAASTTLWVANSPEARAGLLPSFADDAIRRAGGGGEGIGIPGTHLSAFIFLNNVQVALLAFALGIGLAIGTLYVLVQNSILIGALAGAYQAAGEAGTFWSLVLPHGLLEITAICIAAGAGIRLGWSIVDPGDRPRGRALVEEARDAVVVIVGVIPAFGVAALIEGFLTASDVAAAVQLAVGGVAAAGYLWILFGVRPPTAARMP